MNRRIVQCSFFLFLLMGLRLPAQEINYDRRIKPYLIAEFIPHNNSSDVANKSKIQQEHLAYIQTLTKTNRLVLAGPFAKGGGLFILNTNDEETAKTWIEEDPSVKNDLNRYTLRLWFTERGLFTLDNAAPAATFVEPAQLIADSIWIKVYHYYYNTLIRPSLRELLQELGREEEIPLADLALFNMLVQNFDCKQLTVGDFRLRYPFAKEEFLYAKFQSLVQEKLLAQKDLVYCLTEEGETLMRKLAEGYQQLEPLSVPAISIFQTIVKNALQENYSGFNWSLQNRQRASLRFKDTDHTFLQLMTAIDDLVALRNDQAHYRYELIKNERFRLGISLSAPEVEILGSAYANGYFESQQFAGRPTWGYSAQETENYLSHLRYKGLLELKDSKYFLSKDATQLEILASLRMETKFYEAWRLIQKPAYESLKQQLK